MYTIVDQEDSSYFCMMSDKPCHELACIDGAIYLKIVKVVCACNHAYMHVKPLCAALCVYVFEAKQLHVYVTV